MSPRLPLQRVTCDCKVCEAAPVVPASSGQEVWLLQTSQGLFPQLRLQSWPGCEWQGNSAVPQSGYKSPSPGHSAAAAALDHGRTCKEVRICSFVKISWLAYGCSGNSSHIPVEYLSIWDIAVVRPEALFSAVANDSSGSWWLCLYSVAEAKSCAFSLLQSRRNIELRNGIVQGHAYTVTGAVKVRLGTRSCLEILYWWIQGSCTAVQVRELELELASHLGAIAESI